jgi:hypothetical protein
MSRNYKIEYSKSFYHVINKKDENHKNLFILNYSESRQNTENSLSNECNNSKYIYKTFSVNKFTFPKLPEKYLNYSDYKNNYDNNISFKNEKINFNNENFKNKSLTFFSNNNGNYTELTYPKSENRKIKQKLFQYYKLSKNLIINKNEELNKSLKDERNKKEKLIIDNKNIENKMNNSLMNCNKNNYDLKNNLINEKERKQNLKKLNNELNNNKEIINEKKKPNIKHIQNQNNIEFKNEFEDKKIMANKNEEIKEKEKDKKLKNNQNIFKIDNQLVDKNIIKEKYKIKNKSKHINGFCHF